MIRLHPSRGSFSLTLGNLYVILLAISLSIGFALAVRSAVHDEGLPLPAHVPVLAFAIAAAVALASLRPRAGAYAAGLACLLVAIVAFWLASPDGGLWEARFLRSPYQGREFGLVFLALFPLGWVLLAHSVAGWWRGVASYFAVGLLFALINALYGMASGVGLLVMGVLWPYFVLVMLRTFGWHVG